MSQIKIAKPTTEAQRAAQTTTDTWAFTTEQLMGLALPPFQRPLKTNTKVRDLAERIRSDGGVIPGTLTIGVLGKTQYLVDGQHRREAYALSKCEEGIANIRILHFSSLEEMAAEFVEVNASLVPMKPDDILRGLEFGSAVLKVVRKACPYVGYDMIRRNDKSPLLSMSSVLRCWAGSLREIPGVTGSASSYAANMSEEETRGLIEFLGSAYSAWGADPAYYRLWGNLNLMLCMWLYRRLVISAYSTRTKLIDKDQFTRCLMSVSAASAYVDWLLNRPIAKQSLAPAYDRLRGLFSSRIEHDTGKKPAMPSPAWAKSR